MYGDLNINLKVQNTNKMIRYIQFHLHPTQLVENRYRYILITQLLLTIAYPLVDEFFSLRLVLELILLLAFVSAILATIRSRFWLAVSILFSAMFLVSHWLGYFIDSSLLALVSILFGAIFLILITTALLNSIFLVRGKVTTDVILGAISVYLLMGSSFAFIHLFIEMLFPGSFNGIHELQTGMRGIYPDFVYYSFVTLTTLGYGDITPASRIAGMLAYSEAIIGQMYLSILVARLIGMHLYTVKNNTPSE